MRRTSSLARRALCAALLAMLVTACSGNKAINEPGGSGGSAPAGSGGATSGTGGSPGSGGATAGGTGGVTGTGSGGNLGSGGAASGGRSGTGGSGSGTGGGTGVGGVGGGSFGSGGRAIVDAGTTSDGAPSSDAGCPNPSAALSYMATGCGASAPAPLCLIQYLCVRHACSCMGTIISGCQSFQQPFAYIYEAPPPDGGGCDPNTPPPR